jgi:hypothetical protein
MSDLALTDAQRSLGLSVLAHIGAERGATLSTNRAVQALLLDLAWIGTDGALTEAAGSATALARAIVPNEYKRTDGTIVLFPPVGNGSAAFKAAKTAGALPDATPEQTAYAAYLSKVESVRVAITRVVDASKPADVPSKGASKPADTGKGKGKGTGKPAGSGAPVDPAKGALAILQTLAKGTTPDGMAPEVALDIVDSALAIARTDMAPSDHVDAILRLDDHAANVAIGRLLSVMVKRSGDGVNAPAAHAYVAQYAPMAPAPAPVPAIDPEASAIAHMAGVQKRRAAAAKGAATRAANKAAAQALPLA